MLFRKKKVKNYSPENIVVTEENIEKGSRGYSRLKDNILYLNTDGKCQVIQVESSLPHECKTTVSANLAISLGYTDKKVVLLDLDFHRPRLHRYFALGKEIGLGEYLMGSIEEKDLIKDTKYKNVKVITGGVQIYNPSLVLVSDKFTSLIKKLREEYDYIILDCAPILQVSDYIHISKVSDGVLFLVAYGETTKSQVSSAVKELKKNDIKILGTVFTKYNKKKSTGYSDYNRYYFYDDVDTVGEQTLSEAMNKNKAEKD